MVINRNKIIGENHLKDFFPNIIGIEMKKLSQAFLEFVSISDVESISIIKKIIFDLRNSFK